MTTISQAITEFGDLPDIADPSTFEVRMNALITAMLPLLRNEINTWAGQANTVASEIAAYSAIAQLLVGPGGSVSATRAALGAGATGDALWQTATPAAARAVLGGGNLLGVQVFTASGTYTPTAGTNSVVVEVQAPGGGSGGRVTVAAGNWACGRAGGAGGYGMKRITSGFAGTAVTVGAAGTAGAAGDNSGGTGGTTSFGAHVSCTGGGGGGGSGTAQTAAGITAGSFAGGGEATGADISVPGGSPSANGFAPAISSVMSPSGGAARLGPGGRGNATISNNSSGSTPAGYGGGAAAPSAANGAFAAAAGAAGAPGIVIVWEYA